MIDARADVFGKFDMNLAVQISGDVIPPFVAEEYDELYLLYNEFINVAVHRPTVVRLFPLPSIGRKRSSNRGKGSITSTNPPPMPSWRSCFPCTCTS